MGRPSRLSDLPGDQFLATRQNVRTDQKCGLVDEPTAESRRHFPGLIGHDDDDGMGLQLFDSDGSRLSVSDVDDERICRLEIFDAALGAITVPGSDHRSQFALTDCDYVLRRVWISLTGQRHVRSPKGRATCVAESSSASPGLTKERARRLVAAF